MATKPTDASIPFLNLGKDQTAAMLNMQKELLDAYVHGATANLELTFHLDHSVGARPSNPPCPKPPSFEALNVK